VNISEAVQRLFSGMLASFPQILQGINKDVNRLPANQTSRKEPSVMSGASDDIEMNNGPVDLRILSGEDADRSDEGEFEEDTVRRTVFGPMRPQRRQDWEFKRRHIEFMVLGFSPLQFHDLSQGARWVLGYI
jgi:hypothetical protein